jgi:hypothetical protein
MCYSKLINSIVHHAYKELKEKNDENVVESYQVLYIPSTIERYFVHLVQVNRRHP